MTKEKQLEYKKAYVELNEIIKVLSDEQKNKIPEVFKQNLIEDMDTSYKFEFDNTKGIFEQDLKVETKALLVEIYERYLAPEEEKELWEKYDKLCLSKIEEEKRKKYNTDNIFENKEEENKKEEDEQQIQEVTEQETTQMVEYKESIFTRIKNWFKNLFFKK